MGLHGGRIMSANEMQQEPAAPGAPSATLDGFQDLSAEAASLEGGPPVPGTAAAANMDAATIQQTAEELLQALQMARLLVQGMFTWWPDFAAVWGDSTLKGISGGGAAVMQRHGWTMGDLFSKWGPYIALAGATAPPCIATYQAIQHQKERAAAAAKEKAKPTEGGPGDSQRQAQN
jgi:hypothetical protein